MGIGDALMASGEARALFEKTKKPVLIVGRHGRPMWDPVWAGLPYILQRARGAYMRMVNGGGWRPYIENKTPTKWTWRPYKPKPAEIRFTPAELAFAEPFRGKTMIEPGVKAVGHSNKAWPFVRWYELSMALRIAGLETVQCGPAYVADEALDDSTFAVTPTFRHAAAVLSVAKLFVGTDGGLMHAAAAVGTPAVILWSEFTSPDICGYATMTNIRHAKAPCGNRVDCPGCRAAMDAITVSEVLAAIQERLK